MRTLILTVAMAFAVATPAFSQDTSGDRPATAEEIAQARRQADAVIAQAQASDLFVNVTNDATPTAKHSNSGLVCMFSGDTRDRILLFPVSSGIPRGNDVGCGSWLGDTEFTLYATRYSERYSAEQIIRDAVDAILQRFPDARPYQGTLSMASRDDMDTPLAAGFDVTVNGQAMLTLVYVVHHGDWSYKLRATGPADDDLLLTLAPIIFIMSLPGGQ